MPDIKVRIGQQNAVKVVASSFGGSLTAENAVNATNVLGGIASVTQIINSGVTTLTGPVRLGSTLNVSGISTLSGIVTTGSDLYVGGDLYVADDITLDEVNLRNLNVTGISTLGITSATWLEAQQLSLSGISTFNDDVVFTGANTNARWDKSKSDLVLYDNTRLTLGSNEDFQMWHGGSHTFIKNTGGDLRIRGDKILLKREDGSETYLEANVNNEVKLFFNGVEKFATTGVGVTVLGNTETQSLNVTGVSTFVGVVTTSNDLYVGGDLYISDDLVLDNITGNSLKITGLSTFVGHVGLSTGLTVAGVTTFNQDVQFPGAAYNVLWDQATSKFKFDDSAQLVFGSASGGDMKLFHQSGNSTIRNETGQFRIAGNDIRLQTQNHSEDYLLAVDGGSVSIFHNDVKRLETTASGVDITDTLNVAGVSTFVGNAQFNGNVSIGGTLTYEDVTNIDSVGLITARSGVRITDGGLIVTAGISTFDADIYVAGNIRHKGDTDTYIEFTGDQIRLIAGGKPLIHAEESTIDTVIINDGSNDLDFRVEGLNDEHLIFSDGSTDRVGIGSAIPKAKLDVNGTLNVAGVSSFVGVVTTSNDLYVGGDLYIKDDLTFDEFTATNGNITGILTAATANVTGTLTAGLIDGGSY